MRTVVSMISYTVYEKFEVAQKSRIGFFSLSSITQPSTIMYHYLCVDD